MIMHALTQLQKQSFPGVDLSVLGSVKEAWFDSKQPSTAGDIIQES